MWTAILSLLNAALGAFNRWLDRQQAEDLKRLGALEQEQLHIEQERRDAAIASEIDARPVPTDRHAALNGLRKPPATNG